MNATKLGAVLLLAGCAGGHVPPGEEGGDCLLGSPACSAGLVCDQGVCVPGDEPAEAAVASGRLQVEAEAPRRTLEANGRDAVKVKFRVLHETGEPYAGVLLARPNPFYGARVDPPLLVFANGEAELDVRACDAARGPCPPAFVIDLADHDRPTEIVARSAPFRLDGVLDGVDGGGPGGGGGGDVGAPGGGEAPEQGLIGLPVPGGDFCRGKQWRMRVSGAETEGVEEVPEDWGTDVRRVGSGQRAERLEMRKDGRVQYWIDFPQRPLREGNFPAEEVVVGFGGERCRPDATGDVMVVLDRSGNRADNGYDTVWLFQGIAYCGERKFELCANLLR